MRAFLSRLLHRLRGGAGTAEAPGTPGIPLALQGGEVQDATVGVERSEADRHQQHARPGAATGMVPFDENLLERARTQWQFGDWASLAALSRETLQHHPDRAKLALLAAAGHQQVGDGAAARQFTRLAQDWGCNKRLVAQILLAGAHNTIARAAAAAGQVPRALKHFQASVATGMPGTEVALVGQARAGFQLQRMGFVAASGARIGGGGALQQDVASGGAGPASQVNLLGGASFGTDLRQLQLPPLVLSGRPERMAASCLDSDDLHAAVDQALEDSKLTAGERFEFLLGLAEGLLARNDKLSAVHFLRQARPAFDETSAALQARFLTRLVDAGAAGDASDLVVARSLKSLPPLPLDAKAATAIGKSYESARAASTAKSEHGHDLLLAWLSANLKTLPELQRKRVLIEVGSTREDVPGQGSTAKIAAFCKANKLHFVTVDMDPHNAHMAAQLFKRLAVPFEAVAAKGEDYLRDYPGEFDFVFLDAYDFDHGKHSELRQSRYEKFLGSRIDELACHQMHLDCAQTVVTKLAPDGVVCFDDTWLEEGRWTAKGTLGMPFLLEQGFQLVEARNRAALLVRGHAKPQDQA